MAAAAKKSRFMIYSVIFHVVILLVLICGFDFSAPIPVLDNTGQSTDIMKAVMVNPAKIQMPKPIAAPPPKPKVEPKKIEPPAPPPPKPVAKTPEVKKEIAPPPMKEKTIALPDPKKKELQKKLLEKELLAEIKQQKDQQKKTKHNELEQAFEKELKNQKKQQAAKTLEEQLRKETDLLASAQAEKMRGIVDKYKALILQSISQHWLVPNGVNKSLSSQLLIRVAPGGVVLDVQLVKSSGDDALDRSARTAVFKASPLPVPTASDEFEPFREFILKVKPENVLAQESAVG